MADGPPQICARKVPFNVFDSQGQDTGGIITKEYSGLAKELLQINKFSISFPANADANIKANLLGATFLLDYMVFENNDQ